MGWMKVKTTSLYLECLKKGHKVVVRRLSWGLLYLECLDCGKVWRVWVYRMDKLKSEEVPDVFEGEHEYV